MCFSLFSKRKTTSTSAGVSSSSTPTSSRKQRNSTDKGKSMSRLANGNNNNSNSNDEYSTPVFLNGSSSKPTSSYSSSQFSSLSSRTSLSSIRDSLPENPKIYDLKQIQSATKNFRKPTYTSSSSTSWTCTLNSKDIVITQRKLRRSITSTTSLRSLLHGVSRSHHAGLVRLLGASISGEFVYLIHERVEGVSLSECLQNKRNPNFTILSNWLSRVYIAAGLADALDYLHNSSGVKGGFVHNHVKSSSIVVTQEPGFVGKLCHFGTAQICGEPVETDGGGVMEEVNDDDSGGGGGGVKLEGTMGYMSPEMKVTGIATRKSDVYAFGVVLLELLTGDEPLKLERYGGNGGGGYQIRRVSLVETAREMVGGGGDGVMNVRKWVDSRLKDSYPVGVVERMVRLAVECCEEDPNKRPDMGRVAGVVSKRYLESKHWAEGMGVSPTDFTVSYAPR